MLLAQIDFGVRDTRVDNETGWVYGTFLYFNPSTTSPADWKSNLVPVGVMWGNDPGVKTADAFKEQALNPTVTQLRDSGMIFDTAARPVFGWHDRVNGPIDNPKSACLSCHATAQVHKAIPIKHFLTFDALKPASATDDNKMLWFRNIKAGQPFTFSESELKMLNQGAPTNARADWTQAMMADFISTDYSIQLRMAIENARAYSVQKALLAIKNLSPASRQLLTTSPAIKKIERDLQKETERIERSGSQR